MDTPRTRQRADEADVDTCARSLTMLVAIVALLVLAHPRALDAARPARRRHRGRPDSTPVPAPSRSRRRIVRRGRERSAPRHGDASGRPSRRRGARHAGARSPRRSRPSTTSSRSRRSPCPTTTASRPSRWCPPRARTASRPRARARPARPCRRSPGDVTLGVAGQAAINIDISEELADVLPLYLLVVVGLSFLIMSWCSARCSCRSSRPAASCSRCSRPSAAVVAIFQWGWFGDLFGIHSPGPILSFLP